MPALPGPTVAAGLTAAYPLLARPLTAVLTTVGADGRLQCTPVWFAPEGPRLVVSTMREFAKARNLLERPVATLLVVDPGNTSSWVEVRADVAVDTEDAGAVLDAVGERYTHRRPYFGEIVPAELADREHPVTCRLEPVTIRTPPPVPPADLPPPGGPSPRRSLPPLPPSRGCGGDAPLPEDHADLLDAPVVAALATRLPSGRPQTQPVWFARDGGDLLVNTSLERRKGLNLTADPRATLLVIDPADGTRWVEVRADVDLATDGAEAQLDSLTRRYSRHDHYYGAIYPAWQRERETRLVVRLHPRHVHCDAIHR